MVLRWRVDPCGVLVWLILSIGWLAGWLGMGLNGMERDGTGVMKLLDYFPYMNTAFRGFGICGMGGWDDNGWMEMRDAGYGIRAIELGELPGLERVRIVKS